MKLPDQILMNKVYWVNSYFEKIEKLFDKVHNEWMKESKNNFGSNKHNELTNLKNRINFRMKILNRYSSILTSNALKQMNN